MAHAFSVEIHDFLSGKISQAEEGKKQAAQDDDEKTWHYFKGQLVELKTLRSYLTENFDLKTQKYY